jgi:hypothetical protein
VPAVPTYVLFYLSEAVSGGWPADFCLPNNKVNWKVQAVWKAETYRSNTIPKEGRMGNILSRVRNACPVLALYRLKLSKR